MPLVDRYRGFLIYDTREPNYKVLEGKEAFEVFNEASGVRSFRFHAFYNPRQFLLLDDKEKAIQRIVARALPEIRAKIDAGAPQDEMRHLVFTRKELIASGPAPSITVAPQDTEREQVST
ncbi:MAG: hypothetical protein EXR51_11990 [Dehalococcoidia bacterium]|nr:hypothetical protein [Dehalococcoidia bacterium]